MGRPMIPVGARPPVATSDPRIVPGKDFRNKAKFKLVPSGEVKDVNETY